MPFTLDFTPYAFKEYCRDNPFLTFIYKYLRWKFINRIILSCNADSFTLKVCASNALIMLRPEEVEQLVCGCPTLDLHELRKVTLYDGGFKKDDQTIIDFWEVKIYS